MKKVLAAAAVLSVFTTGSVAAQLASSEAPVTAAHAMVVSIHHDATDAGLEILREGGNAVDAAVAVGFALAVVYPNAGNIGGGGFMLIRPSSHKLAGGKPRFLDYREKAPAAASANMYLDAKGNIIPHKSTRGEEASGVPGTVAGLTYAELHYGRLGLAKVMAPAIRFAREGFVLDAEVAQLLHSTQITPYASSRRIFQRDGNFYQPGEVFRQPELASTLERIAAEPDGFYRGAMAKQFADFEKTNHGLITAADLAAYECKERTPLIGHYRGLEVITSPPPSSGGIVLLETLNILGGYDLPKLGSDRSASQVHTITEAFRRAYMDRSDFLGDPDFNPHMPLKQMANPAYASAWRGTIDAVKASPSATLVRPAGYMPSPPDLAPIAHESGETTHFSVVDAEGNAVSSTYTLNFYFGSGVTVDPLGFILNDEMDDFTSKVGEPNGFGLIQGPANAIAPGKRPLSSMTPTIVAEPDHGFLFFKRPGKLRLVLGTPGGSTITTTVANVLISVVDNGMNIQQAGDAPRFHHQYLPDVLQFDKYFADKGTIDSLKANGYVTQQQSEFDEKAPGVWGDIENIEFDPKTGMLMGAHDFRHTFGKAAGY
jgi:gamma-glutamyltranspeptidase/glutathione hydrolase